MNTGAGHLYNPAWADVDVFHTGTRYTPNLFGEALLDQVSAFLQQRLEQTAKIKTALFCPKIVMVMIAVVFTLVVGLIGIGEETGELERAINRLARFYRMQIDDKLNNMSKAIEPVLLVFFRNGPRSRSRRFLADVENGLVNEEVRPRFRGLRFVVPLRGEYLKIAAVDWTRRCFLTKP